MIENLFELIIIGMALTYSRYALLPVLVVANILVYTVITLWITVKFPPIQIPGEAYAMMPYPGYDLFYGVGAIYFLILGFLFGTRRNTLYRFVGIVLLIQALFSAIMLVSDVFKGWHELVSEKAMVVECILVWISARSSRHARV